jgi:hypothetical protein
MYHVSTFSAAAAYAPGASSGDMPLFGRNIPETFDVQAVFACWPRLGVGAVVVIGMSVLVTIIVFVTVDVGKGVQYVGCDRILIDAAGPPGSCFGEPMLSAKSSTRKDNVAMAIFLGSRDAMTTALRRRVTSETS